MSLESHICEYILTRNNKNYCGSLLKMTAFLTESKKI